MALTQDDSTLFYGTASSRIKAYDTHSESVKAVLKGHSGCVWVLKLSHDDKYLFSGSADCTIKVWDLTNKYKKIISIDHGAKVNEIVVLRSNKGLLSAGEKYQPIRRATLDKLKSQGSQRKLVKNSKNREKKSIKPVNEFIEIEREFWIPEHIKQNRHYQKNLDSYQGWLECLPPLSQDDALSLIMFISMEQERNLQLTSEIKELMEQIEEQRLRIAELEKSEDKLVRKISNCELKISQLTFQESESERAVGLFQRNDLEEPENDAQKKELALVRGMLEDSRARCERLESQNQELAQKMIKMEADILQTRSNEEQTQQQVLVIRKNEAEWRRKVKTLEREKTALKELLEEANQINGQLQINFENSKVKNQTANMAQLRKMEQTNSILVEQVEALKSAVTRLQIDLGKKDSHLQHQTGLVRGLQAEGERFRMELEQLRRESILQSRKRPKDPYAQKLITHLESDLSLTKSHNEDLQDAEQDLKHENSNLRDQLKNQTIDLRQIRNDRNSFGSKIKDFKFKNKILISEIEKIRKRMLKTHSEKNFMKTSKTADKNFSFNKSSQSNRPDQVGSSMNPRMKRSRSSQFAPNMNFALTHSNLGSTRNYFDHRVSNQSKFNGRFEQSNENGALLASWVNN